VSSRDVLVPVFAGEIPRELEPGKLYISITYGTVMHLCACGCGHEVVTPLHPERWSLTYNGDTVSLWPSVGSWALPCSSHYVVKENHVRWAPQWSKEKIAAGRRRDQAAVAEHFGAREDPPAGPAAAQPAERRRGLRRILRWR
jgi:hypothetical protein